MKHTRKIMSTRTVTLAHSTCSPRVLALIEAHAAARGLLSSARTKVDFDNTSRDYLGYSSSL
jgi:hypothetical protein